MPGKSLIVSADDFGMSPGVNAAIAAAHRDGILTDAGLMVNGAAFDEAVAMAAEMPSLSTGLHLVLVQGRATASPKDIPSLVDESGHFANHPIACGMRYFFTPGIRDQLKIEIRAQIDKYRATGLDLSHVDGHLNIHMHPTVLQILVELADELGIAALRSSRDPLLPALRFDRRQAVRKTFEAGVFRALSAHAAPRLRARSIRFPDRVYGLHQTGHITEDYLLRTIAELPDGISEIYCHAGFADEESTRWRPADYRGEDELRALTSDRVRKALRHDGVQLTTYRELSRRDRRSG